MLETELYTVKEQIKAIDMTAPSTNYKTFITQMVKVEVKKEVENLHKKCNPEPRTSNVNTHAIEQKQRVIMNSVINLQPNVNKH